MKVIVPVVIGAVVLIGGGVFAWSKMHTGPAAEVAQNVAAVTKGNLIQSVASTGTVASYLDVPIKCRAGGEVLQIGPTDRKKDFDQGDSVKKGDLLLQLDTADEELPLDKAKVQLEESQAMLEQAKQQLIVSQQQLVTNREKAATALDSAQAQSKDADAKAARRKELLAQNLGTQEDYDTAADTAAQMAANVRTAKIAIEDLKTQEVALHVQEQAVKLAEAQVKADTIAVGTANVNLGYTTITSPMDGVVTALTVQKGSIMQSATSNVGGGVSVMTISDLSRMFILANVDEADIDGIKPDQEVKITADARPGQHFTGKVIRVAPFGVVVSNVTTFEVKIEVVSPNKSLLLPLMSANIEIIEAKKDDVLTVPMMAVTRKGQKSTVTVEKKDGTTEDVPVVVGINDGTRDEIVSGLAEGDQVVVHRNVADSKWSQGGQRRGG